MIDCVLVDWELSLFQQVIASRESLVESLEESESDDTNLMSQVGYLHSLFMLSEVVVTAWCFTNRFQEFPTDLDVDPLTLPEIHEHMIRSPPPTTWPRSPNFRMFNFPVEEEVLLLLTCILFNAPFFTL